MPRHMGWLIAIALLLVASSSALAQNASVQGTVVDESGGVMPGVSVTATELETGRQSVAFTGIEGRYRLDNLAPGAYRLEIQLDGFATAQINGVDLLVGTNATVPPVTMQLAALTEVVTVTTQAPLVDLTSSQVAGNIDRRQMEDLPLQGRNWQELSLMVKGITANNVESRPGTDSDDRFQLNLDGQQITQRVASSGFGQPKVSREAIAEFQIVTNQFDITQGRSTGMQVQAISRSGTNVMRASTYGFFRSDKFNAPDPVAGEVLPFENQQVGFTLGGPIILNKAHFFGSYEYEREPSTAFLAPSRLPDQTWQFESKGVDKNYLIRVDYQQSPTNSFTVRAQRWAFDNPFDISSGSSHPSRATQTTRRSNNVFGTWTHVANSNLILQVEGGYNGFNWLYNSQPSMDVDFLNTPFYVPEIRFPGLTIGGTRNYPNLTWQDTYSARADINWHLNNHDVKFGGEFLRVRDTKEWSLNRRGTYVFDERPSTEELERRFPADAWNDPSRWDLSGLEPLLRRFDISFHPDYLIDTPRPTLGLWFGDNWQVTSDLTVNFGVRWDADWGATDPPHVIENTILIDNGFESGDFGYKTGIRDLNNVAPRAGFAWNVNGQGDLVIRGGSGIYFNAPYSNITYSHQFFNRAVAATYLPTGPGFLSNPTAGITAQQYLSGAVDLPVQTARIIAPDYVMPWSWQSSLGFQKQLGAAMGFDVDLTYNKEHNLARARDPNLFFDPVTGYNLNPSSAGRPNPAYGEIRWIESTGKAEQMLLSTSFTKRYSNNFQTSVTYTRALRDMNNTTGFGIQANNQFDLDAASDYARSTAFQRDTFRVNGIFDLPLGVSLSASYFYGSGNYFDGTVSGRPYGKPGDNHLNVGAPIVIPEAMLDRWDGPAVIGTGELWPKNALRGEALHKVDMRLSKRIAFSANVNVTLLAEVFNLFNKKNYGAYDTDLRSSTFGQAEPTSGNAFVPRSAQLGFRLEF